MKEYRFKKMINKNGVSVGCMEYTIPDNAVKQIRADAFDEFADKLKAECRMHYVDCDGYFGGIQESILYEDSIDDIAGQLKEQGDN